MSKSMKIKVIGSAVLTCLVIILLAVAMIKKYMPNDCMMALNEYYVVDETEAIVILETTTQEERAVLADGGIYLRYETVKTLLNNNFYLDEAEHVLLLALPAELVQASEGEAHYIINQEERQLSAPALRNIGGTYFVSTEFVELFSNVEFEYYSNPNRLIVHYQWVDFLYFNTAEEAPLRVEPSIKSEILVQLPEDAKLYYIGGTGTAGRSFIKVMTQDGIYGYVQRKFLNESYYEVRKSSYQAPVYTYHAMGEKVRLGWHQVTVPEANAKLDNILKGTTGLNVIAPTWYRLADEEGNITSLADAAYVEKAHSKGLQVWALVDNFDKNISTFEVLSSTAARTNLIQNLVDEAKKYGLDGINIDFETLSTSTGVHFIQFLKELSIQCRNSGLVLSVDNYVPAPYNEFYDLKTQGEVVDYVIIMAYDEHYSGSPEAGSVASINFVKEAVNNTLAKMPRERIIMGIPFYTRLWKETEKDGQISLSSEALTMAGAESVLMQNGVSASWDEETAQNYVEYEKDGTVYKMWMEDEDSLTRKLQIISEANVSGIAAWRLGYESEEIWPLIDFMIQ